MPRLDLTIPTADGREMPAYFAAPEGDGAARPAILIIHEIFGLTPEIRGVVDRMADHGYPALCPDLYHRGGPKLLCVTRTLFEFQRGRGRAFADLDAARGFLARRPEVDGARLGVMGFCMGGGFALLMAARHPFTAAGVWYGEVPKKAEALAGACPIVASYGAQDRPFRGHGERLGRHLQVVGVDHDVKVYPEAGHAFAFPSGASEFVQGISRLVGMNAGHVPGAAEHAWGRVDRFFGAHLGDPSAAS